MKRDTKKQTKQKINPLPILAGVVLVIALAVTVFPRLSHSDAGESSDDAELFVTDTEAVSGDAAPSAGDTEESAGDALPAGSDLVIRPEEIGTTASYFDYDADGTTVEVFAVRASDDTVRLALNTCQVCNGSPYAYFEQDGDAFVCQNCGNRFSSDDIGKESGGCNPVPITEEIYTEQDETITIPAAFLDDNAERFTQWKAF